MGSDPGNAGDPGDGVFSLSLCLCICVEEIYLKTNKMETADKDRFKALSSGQFILNSLLAQTDTGWKRSNISRVIHKARGSNLTLT